MLPPHIIKKTAPLGSPKARLTILSKQEQIVKNFFRKIIDFFRIRGRMNIEKVLPIDGQPLEISTEVTALFGRRGGHFCFLDARNKPIMPTTNKPIWIRSE